ncbi:YeiH family protein [Bradyrhizobium canariense]|uniref:YeiH family protein n=1 Tax=Bradyrhizobium canariense TaxID=255045 RepID=UPI001FEB20E8|nr:YeiH family protein [Bradyrhizobium canariense]
MPMIADDQAHPAQTTTEIDRRDDDAARARPHFAILPGLLLTATIAASAFSMRRIPGIANFSPMILAIVIGMALHNMRGTPALAKAGVSFSLRRVLRFAIILLGLQLTASQVLEVGAKGMVVIVVSLIATFAFTIWLGRLIGVDRKLSELIAAGTSICGASAVIATNTVTKARDEDTAYAIACVTVFGSVAMFGYPLLQGALHLDAHAYGLWVGSSIHEIAQVVAASFQGGKEAGDFGTIAKLARVAMLAPVVIALSFAARHRARSSGVDKADAKTPIPWFVLGFIAMVCVNSLIAVPPAIETTIVTVTTFLLSMALAAMGLEADIAKLRAKGLRPLLLGFAAFLFIAGFSLLMVKMTA